MAQSVKSDLSSGHDLTVREFKPRVGPVLTAHGLEPASDFVPSSLFAPPPTHTLSLSLSQKTNIKKIIKKEKYFGKVHGFLFFLYF